MKQHITREYILGLSTENARGLMMAECAQYNEETGEVLSIVDNVSDTINRVMSLREDMGLSVVY